MSNKEYRVSRIGKQPITVPGDVTCTINENTIMVKGALGVLSSQLPSEVQVTCSDNIVRVECTGETKRHRAFHGLYRAIINSMVIGVSQGFKRELEIQGVGYTADARGKNINLNLGFSHSILFKPPAEITIELQSRTAIVVKGIDKQLVGEVAAKIRSFRPPEPYKGKGIRYVGEEVRRKVGKTSG
jgi:large subunit ribosomal protein L6